MKERLQNMNVTNKRVILRCDLNVPMKDGKILDDNKILESLETITYLLDHNASVIILSHLGKVKTEKDKLTHSLEPVAKRLKELLNTKVIFSKQTRSVGLDEMVRKLMPKDILVLENTRFEDVPNNLESGNDSQLASYWASLGDIFVMDAFGSSHRCHASTYGIAKYIPSCIGFLIQKEMTALNDYVLNPEKPFTIIMGGAKIDDKLELMNKLLPKCDYMLLMGGLANTCLKVLGFNVGQSIVSNDSRVLTDVKTMLLKYKEKISLPYDAIVGNDFDDSYIQHKMINNIDVNDSIKDIGSKTIEEYKKIILKSMTIFTNGTAGVYEDLRYANGTKEIYGILAKSETNVIVGGGDAASAVRNFGFANSFTYISTGGGATLEYIVNESLPALEAIPDEVEVL
jgi:phosphoglycerate kinase